MTTSLTYTISRNPTISLEKDGSIFHKILCIGDPHLGRAFKTGVPSDRVGDREKIVYNNFYLLLNPKDPLIKDVVVMGDLFDKFIVSPTVVLRTFRIVLDAIKNNPKIRYTILPGNHDLSKDVTKASSYELFVKMCSKFTNTSFNVLLDQPHYLLVDYKGITEAVLSFDVYKPIQEDRTPFKDKIRNSWKDAKHIISFGHWDSLEILESGYVPDQELLEKSSLVVSGHEHTYKEYIYPFDKSKTKVLFTGSMQPYSHAEDPDKYIYMTIDQEALPSVDLTTLEYKVVRILCDNSFYLSTPINCLALSYLYKEVEEETVEELEYVDDSYNTVLYSFIKDIKSETKYEKELLTLFQEKGFINVSS